MLRLTIEHDRDTDNPLDGGSSWAFFSFNQQHRLYRDPADFITPKKNLSRPLCKSLEQGLAFWCEYYDIGKGLWKLHDSQFLNHWDTSGRAGLMLWEQDLDLLTPKTYDERKQDAATGLDELTKWWRGECYRFKIQKLRVCTNCDCLSVDEEIYADDNIIGAEPLIRYIRNVLDTFPGVDIQLSGDASDLAHRHPIRTPSKTKTFVKV